MQRGQSSWGSPAPKALVADAEDVDATGVDGVLKHCGWSVRTARTLREVERVVPQEMPQLLFCDTNLQPDAVEELAHRLREASYGTSTPIVLTSEERSLDLRLAGLRAGATDFVLKSAGGYIRATRSRQRAVRSPVAPGRILVVDDSPTYGNTLLDALGLDGHDVVLAASVKEARDYLALQAPDVVLLDVYLPDGDGVDLAHELRGQANTHDLPIMMLTGCESKLVRQRAAAAQVSSFSAKNVPMTVLRKRVRDLQQRATEGGGSGGQEPRDELRGEALFAQVLTLSGLSVVLGRSTLERAFEHAGVDPQRLTREGVRKALPQLERALRTFQSPEDAAARLSSIENFLEG